MVRLQRDGTTVDVSESRAEVLRRRGYTDAETPNVSDNKPVWVDYAVSQGADRDEAEAMTKADLQKQYG